MAIGYCKTCDLRWDGDYFTECPKCEGDRISDAPTGSSLGPFVSILCAVSRSNRKNIVAVHNDRAMLITPDSATVDAIGQWDRIGHHIAVMQDRKAAEPVNLLREILERLPFDASTRDLYDRAVAVLEGK